MKLTKRLVCFSLVVLALLSLCACDSATKTTEDEVRDAVTTAALSEYVGSTIGGKELKSSTATISTVKEITSAKYLVSGKMTMVDIYGDRWTNSFDCEVIKGEYNDKWTASSFEYTSENWKKD